jgi:hypothetical protein
MSKGFLIYAKGSDYLKQAYLCTLSIKASKNSYPVTIVTDDVSRVTTDVYDNVIEVPWKDNDTTRYQTSSRWKNYHATPYDETIVLDSDVLVLQNIDKWWEFLEKYDIFFPSRVYTYRNELVTSDYYRKAFVVNHLPNLYSGFHYFKKSDKSKEFFEWLELISNNWELFYGKMCSEYYPKVPSFDISVAIASKILGVEHVITNKKIDFLRFTHMKPRLQGWNYPKDLWTNQVGVYLRPNLDLIIGNFYQTGIFHYVENEFVTSNMIECYENAL